MRIPRSWAGPHMVTFQTRPAFYGRLNANKIPLDIEQIRSGFVEADTLADRIRNLRAERIARIGLGETPAPVSGAAVVLHLVPQSS